VDVGSPRPYAFILFHNSFLWCSAADQLRFSKWLIILKILFDRMADNRQPGFSGIGLPAILQKPQPSNEQSEAAYADLLDR
jgi:hypothetical protein